MNGSVIRSMKYSGNIPRGSVVCYQDENTVRLPASGSKVCGVYSQYKNENAEDAATGEALPITVMGPAKVCVNEAVTAGAAAYVKGTSGEAGVTAEGGRLIGRYLEDGASGDYVLVLVQVAGE